MCLMQIRNWCYTPTMTHHNEMSMQSCLRLFIRLLSHTPVCKQCGKTVTFSSYMWPVKSHTGTHLCWQSECDSRAEQCIVIRVKKVEEEDEEHIIVALSLNAPEYEVTSFPRLLQASVLREVLGLVLNENPSSRARLWPLYSALISHSASREASRQRMRQYQCMLKRKYFCAAFIRFRILFQLSSRVFLLIFFNNSNGQHNSPTVEFSLKKIEGNLRWANKEHYKYQWNTEIKFFNISLE